MSSHFLSSTPMRPRPTPMCNVAIESYGISRSREHTTPCISSRSLAVHNGRLSQ